MNTPIKRYEADHYEPGMEESLTGDYCLASDVEKARAEDVRTIAGLRDTVKRIEYLTRTLMSKDGIINSIACLAKEALK